MAAVEGKTVKDYRIFYRFAGREYEMVMPGTSAYGALLASEVMMMPGGKAFGIEVVR